VASDRELDFRLRFSLVTPSARELTPNELGTRIGAAFEPHILADPGQWYGINRIFRHTPSPASALRGERDAVGVLPDQCAF
jgi:hypothetical protein